MSFLSELVKKKENLKPSQTVVTYLSGNKCLETKNDKGDVEVMKLTQVYHGFVVDEKLDLQIVEVMKHLYLSSQDVAQDLELLKKNGITHVLTVGVDLPNFSSSSTIIFKKVELKDEPTEDFLSVFNSCFEFIENARLKSDNNKVLVHCNAGYSRAPTIVIAYLMTKQGYSLNESFDIVNKKRNIKPNSGFMKQLKKLEKDLKVSQTH